MYEKKCIRKTKPYFYFNLVRIMKLASFMLLLSITSIFAAELKSQSILVNITMKNVKTRTVLDEIERQTDYLFLFNPDVVDTDKQISVNAKNKTVSEVLKTVFRGTNIYYKQEGSSIFLINEHEQVKSLSQVEKIILLGVVVDSNGDPIIGANILEKGKSNITVTDVDGNFSLIVDKNSTLQISYISYLAQEITVGNQTHLNITLLEDTQALDEVVVVGYGVMRRKDLTGALTSINTEIIDKSSIKSVDQMLQGRSSGLYTILVHKLSYHKVEN
jgi:hypothetical protein